MKNKEEIRLQRVVMALCAILFAVFSFLFVAEYQSSLLELLYDKVATGKLEYNGYVAGGVISLALTLLALWINKYTGFKREWIAFAFMPSALILSFITDIDRSLYVGGYDYIKWIIVLVAGIIVYALFSFVLRRVLFAKIKNIAMSANRIIWRNLVLFVILFSLVGFLSNGEENFKREARVASYYKEGDIESALNVGSLSNVASHSLTAQRAYILAKNGMLGEKVFEYPQLYKAAGLIPERTQVSPLVPDSVFALLGISPSQDEKPMEFLKRAVMNDSVSDAVKDYYLSGLLLDRQIVEFTDAVKEFYPDTELNKLPKHYQEALMLYASIDENATSVNNQAMQEQFDALLALEKEHDDAFVRANYVRRRFGRTYWWYYLYGSI